MGSHREFKQCMGLKAPSPCVPSVMAFAQSTPSQRNLRELPSRQTRACSGAPRVVPSRVMRLLVCVMFVVTLGCETIQVRPAPEAPEAPPTEAAAAEDSEAPSPAALSLSVGPRSSCAALEDGSLWCWGDSDDGLLGDNSGPGPVRLLEAAGLSRVVVGHSRVCFLADEGMRCFGNFYSRRTPANAVRTSPFAVPGMDEASDLAIGVHHICFITADKSVRCNGVGPASGNVRSHRLGAPIVSSADGVAVGAGHSCALTDGHVECWGEAGGGRLGGASVRFFTDSPRRVPDIEGVRAISAYGTGAQTCALLDEDDIRCWGMTGQPVSGGSPAALHEPHVRLEAAGEPIARIISGVVQVFAIAESGAVYRYLSQEPVAIEGQPRKHTSYGEGVRLELPAIADIGVGLTQTCALTREGAVLCWGLGAGGRLGNSTDENLSAPTRVHFREASEE
jgi:alpha-tubulin suppressor-like RCC1 family protein